MRRERKKQHGDSSISMRQTVIGVNNMGFTCCSSTLYSLLSTLTFLKVDEFEKYLKKSGGKRAGHGAAVFVKFFAPWCAASKSVAITFDQMARHMQLSHEYEDVKVVEFNCDDPVARKYVKRGGGWCGCV